MASRTFSCCLLGGESLLIQCGEALLSRGHEILGIGSADPSIRAWAESRSIEQFDPLEGWDSFTRRSFDYLFSIANLVVLPSYTETYGMAATEAMAAGVPVVVSDRVDVSSDVAAVRAGLVVPVERDRLARAIVSVLRRPDEARQMGAASTSARAA